MNNLYKWYYGNLGKILLFFIVIVTFTLTVVYIPYLNVLFSSLFAVFVVILSWYLLFPPPTILLVVLAFIALFVGFLCSVLRLEMLSEISGEGVYIFLIFIFINKLKNYLKTA